MQKKLIMTKDDIFYSIDPTEKLQDNPDSAIEEFIDDVCCGASDDFDVWSKEIDWPIKIDVYRRIQLTDNCVKRIAERTVERILEDLDDEFGEPGSSDSTAPTDKIIRAAEDFAQAIVEDYVCWQCEKTGRVINYTFEQAKNNAPCDY